MQQRLFLLVFSLVFSLSIAVGEGTNKTPKYHSAPCDAPAVSWELPRANNSANRLLIYHVGYSVCYDVTWHLPVWVAYLLTHREVCGTEERASKFLPDPQIKRNPVVTSDYTHSGYDRGHMAPAADMKWSQQAMKESFYMTNICPQNRSNNAGDWKDLEEFGRDLAKKYDSIYIACGPIVTSTNNTIGEKRKIVVPSAFYKTFLRKKKDGTWTAIGFVMPNAPGNRPLMTYMKTIDEVEQIVGLNLYYQLPDSIQKTCESDIKFSDWTL